SAPAPPPMATLMTSVVAVALRVPAAVRLRPWVDTVPSTMALALPPEVAEPSMAERGKPPTEPPFASPLLVAFTVAERLVSPATVKLAEEPSDASTSPLVLVLASPTVPPTTPREPPNRWAVVLPVPWAVTWTEPAPTVLLTLALVRPPVVALADWPAMASPPAAAPSEFASAVLLEVANRLTAPVAVTALVTRACTS